jgi:hypothetical protein
MERWWKTVGLKRKKLIGFWNVRTLFEVGKLYQVVTEMKITN